eukprot:1369491-Amorphochlora_amoeboformis.AAC.3
MALDAGTGHAADARMAQALFERGEYHKSSDILRNFSKTSVRDSLPPLRHNALVAEYLAAREGFPEDEKIKSSSAVSPSPDPWAVIDALGKLRETGEGDMSFESLSVLKYNQASLYLEVRCYDVVTRRASVAQPIRFAIQITRTAGDQSVICTRQAGDLPDTT